MNRRQSGLVPILFVAGALAVLVSFFYPESVLPRGFVYDLPAPFSFAHSLFLSFAAIFMSYFFARGFVKSGSVNLVTLGVGSLILGAGFLVSQILGYPPFGVANEQVGISSLVFLSSGILFAVFSTLSLVTRDKTSRGTLGLLVLGYVGGLALVGLITLSVALNTLPPFFVPGKGVTLLREDVLGTSIALYAYSALVGLRSYQGTRDDIQYWFSLGLAAITVGFTCAFLGTFPGGPYSWLGRVSLIVGGIYFIAAILIAYKSVDSSRNVRAATA